MTGESGFVFCAAMPLRRPRARSIDSLKSAGKNIGAGIQSDFVSFRRQERAIKMVMILFLREVNPDEIAMDCNCCLFDGQRYRGATEDAIGFEFFNLQATC